MTISELIEAGQPENRVLQRVSRTRQCAAWLTQLDTGRYPPVVNLRPIADWPAT
ncbi:hypothetical protein AB0L88_01260 [Saccharopolyspora shandongensis]|uniref:hypothetical protein n=1 Tax=Saccharopolyspora shandongensis TaxID=418495 RepID=UPI0034438EAC